MTAKEKARELVNKYNLLQASFYKDQAPSYGYAKQCALIAVDEILDDDVYDMSEELFEKRINFWEEVKHEIQNL